MVSVPSVSASAVTVVPSASASAYDEVQLEQTFGNHMLSFPGETIDATTSNATSNATSTVIATLPPTAAVVTVHENESIVVQQPQTTSQVKCQFCEATFARAGNLSRHVKKFHAEQEERRQQQQQQQQQIVVQHQLLDSTQVVYQQQPQHEARLAVQTQSVLAASESLVMNSDELYRCSQCDHTSKRKDNMKKHMVRMHVPMNDPFECCGQVFYTMFDKRTHQRDVHPNGRYGCRFCDRVYHDLHEYTRHMNAHNNIRPFKCHMCDHSSSSKFNLQKHLLRVHQSQLSSGEVERLSSTKRRTAAREVPCRFCNTKLVNASALKKHMKRKHSEIDETTTTTVHVQQIQEAPVVVATDDHQSASNSPIVHVPVINTKQFTTI